MLGKSLCCTRASCPHSMQGPGLLPGPHKVVYSLGVPVKQTLQFANKRVYQLPYIPIIVLLEPPVDSVTADFRTVQVNPHVKISNFHPYRRLADPPDLTTFWLDPQTTKALVQPLLTLDLKLSCCIHDSRSTLAARPLFPNLPWAEIL